MKKINILVTLAFLAFNAQAQEPKIAPSTSEQKIVKPYYQGEVISLQNAGGYTYLEVKEHSDKTFWVAVTRTEVQLGDYVRFQKELVTKNFISKTLNKTFEELMFASNLQYKVLILP